MDTAAPHAPAYKPLRADKFTDPDVTADGKTRASVALAGLRTLWINTGTLCNIACTNCYIDSSPRNDRLAYFTAEDARALYDEIAQLGLPTREIAFTGGEPFLNPDMLEMAGEALKRGFSVLILTNAMTPMQRPHIQKGLEDLRARHGARLTLRVSLDHYSRELHEKERGAGTFDNAVAGLDWLAQKGFKLAVAARTCWGESEDSTRAGFAALFAGRGYGIDAADREQLVLFPEMNERADVSEITTECWGILGLRPEAMMCASSRMAVRRKGAGHITVLPCTLIAYDPAFDMGASLAEAAIADGGNFSAGAIKLNHPHCARFCVLGGGACSR
ncbi:MAG: radical SAM protein [Rhodobiaceae bacterium]|nr:radical SAM protein [Rhodobiaceae bacterium]